MDEFEELWKIADRIKEQKEMLAKECQEKIESYANSLYESSGYNELYKQYKEIMKKIIEYNS